MAPIDFSHFVNELATLSGQAILPFFRTALSADDKSRGGAFDPVTEADRAGEAAAGVDLDRIGQQVPFRPELPGDEVDVELAVEGEGLQPALGREQALAGPAEVARLQVLGGAIRSAIGAAPLVLVGGKDFGGFLRAVDEAVDLVVATDSGTAHLTALVRPVVSLFGGSPWRRFARNVPRITIQRTCAFRRLMAERCI